MSSAILIQLRHSIILPLDSDPVSEEALSFFPHVLKWVLQLCVIFTGSIIAINKEQDYTKCLLTSSLNTKSSTFSFDITVALLGALFISPSSPKLSPLPKKQSVFDTVSPSSCLVTITENKVQPGYTKQQPNHGVFTFFNEGGC